LAQERRRRKDAEKRKEKEYDFFRMKKTSSTEVVVRFDESHSSILRAFSTLLSKKRSSR